jgi:threonine/homoserine/homoserine lactone efflux protein
MRLRRGVFLDFSLFVKGLIIGFSIAAPVGPIGVLCIRRTLADGRLSGFVSGMGAATADALYGCVAGFGITFVSSFLIGQQFWFRLIGALFLGYLGVKAFVSKPAEAPSQAEAKGLTGAYASTLFLTLTNPVTILAFAAIFAGLGLGNSAGGYTAGMFLVLGVFLGSAAWWLFLSVGVGLFRAWFDGPRRRWVNRLSGVIIAGFGVLALLSLLEYIAK